jgi:hypothetical protein
MLCRRIDGVIRERREIQSHNYTEKPISSRSTNKYSHEMASKVFVKSSLKKRDSFLAKVIPWYIFNGFNNIPETNNP